MLGAALHPVKLCPESAARPHHVEHLSSHAVHPGAEDDVLLNRPGCGAAVVSNAGVFVGSTAYLLATGNHLIGSEVHQWHPDEAAGETEAGLAREGAGPEGRCPSEYPEPANNPGAMGGLLPAVEEVEHQLGGVIDLHAPREGATAFR